MEKTGRALPALCPTVERAFEILGRKWAGLVVRELSAGPRHFCELEQGIPAVSARMLTERIKELEAEGIVSRTVHTAAPVRVTYDLTEKGRALIPVMRGIESWAQRWSKDRGARLGPHVALTRAQESGAPDS